jgi:hypothetical protein
MILGTLHLQCLFVINDGCNGVLCSRIPSFRSCCKILLYPEMVFSSVLWAAFFGIVAQSIVLLLYNYFVVPFIVGRWVFLLAARSLRGPSRFLSHLDMTAFSGIRECVSVRDLK